MSLCRNLRELENKEGLRSAAIELIMVDLENICFRFGISSTRIVIEDQFLSKYSSKAVTLSIQHVISALSSYLSPTVYITVKSQ